MLDIIFYILGFLLVSFGFVVFFGSPYVPTLKPQLAKAMRIYKLKPSDVFVDVGSGDGVVLRAAAGSGARVIGYELSPWMYLVSKFLCRRYKNIEIRLVNFWQTDLPVDTTVVYTFLNGRHMSKLANKLQSQANSSGKTIFFISYGFELPAHKPLKIHDPIYLYRFKPV